MVCRKSEAGRIPTQRRRGRGDGHRTSATPAPLREIVFPYEAPKGAFAHSNYWIALLNPRDDLHDKAVAVSASLGLAHVVTSEMVLLEVMNYYSAHGSNLRKAAVTLVERLRAHPHTTLVPLSSVPFQEALGLYAQREDKTWSLTDCATFQIMQNEQITGALTIRTPAILDRCAVE